MKRLLAMLLGLQVLLVALGATVLAPGADAVDARQRCIPAVPGLYPHGVTGGRDAVLMIHGWTGTPAAWTQPIDATVRPWNQAHGFTFVEQIKRIGDVDVWLLDYHDASARWVTDPAVGGVVADAIDCLADAYGRPIGIAAHSMGGLAVRQVASEDERESRIAALVTFGTPHTGSDGAAVLAAVLGVNQDPGDLALVQPAHTQLLRLCGMLTTLRASACWPLPEFVAAFHSQAGEALRSGSLLLRELPALPGEFPTLSIAGDLELASQQSFGLFYQDIARLRLGDVIVTAGSATAQGSETEQYRCRHNLRSDLGVLGFVRTELGFDFNDERGPLTLHRSPCLHWRLMRGTEPTTSALGFLYEHLRGEGSADGGPLPIAGDAPGPRSDAGSTARGPEPVLLVLDVSASMTENDGTGTVRLDGAKTALADMLFELPPGTPTGVRYYPDPGGPDCNGGRALQPVAPLNAARTTALIDGLTANGNTPTGTALEHAVDELRAQGFDHGQLVLVSDGESNCGPPPCDVARTIVADGFDIAVNTLGFQTSPAGREELTCIAGVTGGRHVDAQDSEELTAELVALTGVALDVSVVHEATVPSGLPTRIEVTVTNASGMLAEDVNLTLAFQDAGAGTVLPAVLPPRFRLGNIPAGERVSRTWDVVAGATGDQGQAVGRVTAWGPTSPAVTAEATITVTSALASLQDAGELLRTVADAGGRVAILGDSYSSGEGARAYLAGTDTPDNRCHRSEHTYAVSLFGRENVSLLACSGAVTRDFFGVQAGNRGTRPQLRALADVEPRPDLVLLTIGGNDVGFGAIVRSCLMPGDCTDDHGLVYRTLRDVELLGPHLERVYRYTASSIDNEGTVVVLAYPLVLPYQQRASCTGFSTNEIVFANHLARQLNGVIARSVAAVRAEGYDVRFVPQSAQAVLPSNTACHADPYVVPVDLLIGAMAGTIDAGTEYLSARWWARAVVEETSLVQELLHPNRHGYRAVTQSLVRWSRSIEGEAPDEEGRPEPPLLTLPPLPEVITAPVTTIELRVEQPDGVRTEVRQGDPVQLQGGGFGPGAPVTVVLQSRPVALASVTADAEGEVDVTVAIPEDAATGAHRLVAAGGATDGGWHEVTARVSVRAPRPGWVLPALVAVMVSALVAAAGVTVLQRDRQP
jgi:hypothetical protein